MAQLNNPAGRLHAVLMKFRQASSGGNVPIRDAWKQALGTKSDISARVGVARVAALVPEIEAALEAAGDEEQIGVFRHFGDGWLMPILTPSHQWQQAGSKLLTQEHLVTLGSLSSFLSRYHPEGTVPDESKQEELRGKVADALATLRQSDLPEVVKVAMVRRFHDMQWAMDHLDVAGPEGVKAAAERLTAMVVLQEPSLRQKIANLGVMDTVLYSWVAFSSGPAVASAVEAWSQLLQIGAG